MEAQADKTFFQDDNATVTQSRFVTGSKTFAMRNVSSVTLFEIKADRTIQWILIIVGVILLFTSYYLAGIAIAGIGALWLKYTKNQYSVRISTNAGETNGFISKDKEYVQSIVNAINDAIIYRG